MNSDIRYISGGECAGTISNILNVFISNWFPNLSPFYKVTVYGHKGTFHSQTPSTPAITRQNGHSQGHTSFLDIILG